MIEIKEVRYSNTGAVCVTLSQKQGKSNRLSLDYETWRELGLCKEVPLSELQLEILIAHGLYHQVREKALSLLAKREYAAQELKLRLRRHTSDSEMLQRCLCELQKKDLQSDVRYAHARIRYWLSSKAKGAYWMRGELQSKGITRDLAESLLQEYEEDALWEASFLECARKQFSRIQRTSKVKNPHIFRQKMYQHGFSGTQIDLVLSERDALESDS